MKTNYVIIVCILTTVALYGASPATKSSRLLTVPSTPCNTPLENPPTPPSPQTVLSSAVAHFQNNYTADTAGKLTPRRLTITVEPPAQPSQSLH